MEADFQNVWNEWETEINLVNIQYMYIIQYNFNNKMSQNYGFFSYKIFACEYSLTFFMNILSVRNSFAKFSYFAKKRGSSQLWKKVPSYGKKGSRISATILRPNTKLLTWRTLAMNEKLINKLKIKWCTWSQETIHGLGSSFK